MTKILVVGVGAIGGLYAAKLAQGGAEVSVVCRSDYEEVKQGGIAIKSYWGDFNFKPAQVLRDVKDFKGEADFIIIATKALPEISLPKLIAPAVRKNTTIAIIQNGIFIEKDLAKAFPSNQLLSVIAFVGVRKEKPAFVEHDAEGRLTIGEYQNPDAPKTKILFDILISAGVPCVLSADIQLDRWKKLLWNASFNPISVAAGGLDTKEILDDEKLHEKVKNVMREVAILAKAQGYEISEELMDQTIDVTYKRKVPAITSMLLDFRSKRKMEIEAILGNALNFAKEKSLHLPLMENLYQKIVGLNNEQN